MRRNESSPAGRRRGVVLLSSCVPVQQTAAKHGLAVGPQNFVISAMASLKSSICGKVASSIRGA